MYGWQKRVLKDDNSRIVQWSGVEEIPVQEILGIPSNLVGLCFESILPGEEKSTDVSLPNFPI